MMLMFRNILFILAAQFTLMSAFVIGVGCSSSNKKSNAPQTSSDELDLAAGSDSLTPGALTKAQVNKSKKVVFNSNDLITKISEYTAKNPEASLKQVARHANSLVKELGLPFALVAPSAEIIGSETFIKTKDGQRLNVGIGSEPLCATGIAVTFPVVRFNKKNWWVKYKNEEFLIEAEPLRIGEIRREKDKTSRAQIPLPEEGADPGGIDTAGRSAYVQFALNRTAGTWWRRVLRRDPKEENPYLILVISENDFIFSDDEGLYDIYQAIPEKKMIDEETYILKFPDSKYVFQSPSCS